MRLSFRVNEPGARKLLESLVSSTKCSMVASSRLTDCLLSHSKADFSFNFLSFDEGFKMKQLGCHVNCMAFVPGMFFTSRFVHQQTTGKTMETKG